MQVVAGKLMLEPAILDCLLPMQLRSSDKSWADWTGAFLDMIPARARNKYVIKEVHYTVEHVIAHACRLGMLPVSELVAMLVQHQHGRTESAVSAWEIMSFYHAYGKFGMAWLGGLGPTAEWLCATAKHGYKTAQLACSRLRLRASCHHWQTEQ